MHSKIPAFFVVALIGLPFAPHFIAVAASSDPAWTRFEDPFEHAFTMEVPQGWSVKGGLFRIGYSDVRPKKQIPHTFVADATKGSG